MSAEKVLVLDANILIRACLGSRVFQLLEKFEPTVFFYSPDVCFADANRHLSTIVQRRRLNVTPSLLIEQLGRLVHPINVIVYREFENAAKRRIADRDPTDWHIVATALFLKCPIWTEDKDFFGVGVPTWTTNRVEVYLSEVH
jgi:predicted nucleic acid-binding protein